MSKRSKGKGATGYCLDCDEDIYIPYSEHRRTVHEPGPGKGIYISTGDLVVDLLKDNAIKRERNYQLLQAAAQFARIGFLPKYAVIVAKELLALIEEDN